MEESENPKSTAVYACPLVGTCPSYLVVFVVFCCFGCFLSFIYPISLCPLCFSFLYYKSWLIGLGHCGSSNEVEVFLFSRWSVPFFPFRILHFSHLSFHVPSPQKSLRLWDRLVEIYHSVIDIHFSLQSVKTLLLSHLSLAEMGSCRNSFIFAISLLFLLSSFTQLRLMAEGKWVTAES